ncbi:membrane-associated guanylate kinase, WW and PDZ domain-containing protein 2-like [Lytechinus pictus]|uniref:membrane-associated guanylate kinase, WW and PDZ domain-containing protein 2-like n=1 Tax=Lytechinus pictus TaxID=7653 RepID=UPI0030B9D0BE
MALVSSITATMKDKKNPKPPKHWTQNIQECTLRRAPDGGTHFALGGGAEHGQFPHVLDIRTDKILLESGKLHIDDILLELNGYKLAGYTLWDLKSLINHVGSEALRFKTLKSGYKFMNFKKTGDPIRKFGRGFCQCHKVDGGRIVPRHQARSTGHQMY